MVPQKVQDVQDWPIPETIHDVKSFLGFVGYYRKFIQGFSSIAKPLYSLYEFCHLQREMAAHKNSKYYESTEHVTKFFDLERRVTAK